MKKRVITILIVLAALIGLFVLPTNAATNGALMAGYCKVDIDPNRHTDADGNLDPILGLPMGGYGAVTERLSGYDPDTAALGTTSGMDDNGDDQFTAADGLYATCTALTDQYGNTIIHFGVDNTNSSQEWTNDARTAVFNALKAKGYDVPYSNIFVTASHSHSSPSMTFDKTESNVTAYPEIAERTKLYREWVCSQMADAAVSAMADRVEVTMTKGSVDASTAIGKMYSSASNAQKRMNWVRHYKSTKDGETVVGGSNFGGYGSDTTMSEVSTPNDVMQLVQFTPVSGSKDPILLVNWAAHATMNSSGGSGGSNTSTYGGIHHYDTSSDYVGALRYWLETAGACKNSGINTKYYSKVSSTQTYRVSFISGAAGNVTPTTSHMTSTSLSVYQDPDVKGTTTAKSPEGRLYGQKLAAIARYGLANSMTDALDTSAIRVQSKTFTYDRQQPTESDKEFIYSMREVTVGDVNLVKYLTTNSTNWATRSNYYEDFPYLEKFTSRYQLSNMNSLVTNYYDNGKTTGSMTVSAIAIGTQLSFTVNPCELADRFSDSATLSNTSDNDWDDLTSSTYGTPLIMGYTNGVSGYVPNSLAYSYNSGSTSSGGDGADISDKYITGSYESSGASFAKGTGEDLIVFYKEMLADVNTTESRIQCECGGKAEGVGDHVCSDKEYLPWSDGTSLPTGGNYYLTTDVTLSKQLTVNTLRLDLNGHTITHKVTDASNSRVLCVNTDNTLTITDSTSNPGSIKRDLSGLTDPAISNWGLLVIVYNNATYVQYGGILDSTGNSTTGGGACVSANYSGSVFKMYGGTLTGGTAKTGGLVYNAGTTVISGGTLSNGTATGDGGLIYSTGAASLTINGGTLTGGTSENGGAICSAGPVTVLGGTITGNKTATNGICPGIYITGDGTLTIGGTANIDDNKKTTVNVEINIRFKDETKLPTNFTVRGAFTGKAGIYVGATHANGYDIGESKNASFTSSNLWLDYKNDYPLMVSGDDVIMATVRNQCECGGTATSGKYGHTCEKVDFVPLIDTAAFTTGGNYYLLDDLVTTEQINFSGKKVCLDLNGKSVTHTVAADATDTRVLAANSGAYLSVTDSTSTAGTITRDLSALTDDQKAAIGNYGLMIYVGNNSTAVLYNGTLDATGQYAGGGACVSNHHTTSTFKMYGGSLLGGISNYGGVMYNRGTAELYGGTLTGGVTKANSGHCGGISVQAQDGVSGKVIIGGDVSITGNAKSNGNETNIRYSAIANMADNFTVSGDFTGDVGIFIASADRSHNLDIGNLEDASFTASNLTLDYHTDGLYEISVSGNDLVLVTTQKLCECGGKAAGKYGHTCENVTWTPWTDDSALPTDAGYYYLATDVTTTAQKSVKADIHLDLRGHTITHKVQSGSTNTRVFYIASGGSLTITDSTDTPGTVTRDLSNLTTEQKEAITNYGLIVFLSNDATTGSFTLYDGTLDATGMYTCGGAVTSLNKQDAGSKIVIYGGTVKGAISRAVNSDGGYAGAIYSRSPVEIHGGLVTGGSAQYKGGGVYLNSATSSLLLTGDGSVTGNTGADGASNVYSSYSSTNGNVTVSGTFTGTVGFQINTPADNARVAVSDSAVITDANLSVDNYPSYAISVSGTKLVMNSIYAASITSGDTTSYITSLDDAISSYPGGDAVLTILKDSSENVTFTQDTILDLNGCDLTGTVTANGALTVLDSQTDDLTVEDNFGYGKLPTSMTAATAADGYVKITESDGISFHKLILQTVGINLRSSTTGMYYTSDFGGDEIIKGNLKSFGVALGANKVPDFSDKTYTAFSADSWTVGINADGSTKNRTNGTILQGILSPDNTYSENRTYAEIKVWGVAYIELNDNTRITESNTVKYSLRDIIEGYDGFSGADDLWENLNATQQTEAVTMYQTYQKIMKNWDIPNIKQALVDSYDDGVLKVLVVGHSLGMDGSYYTPMVARENGIDMVMGTLYHSGCKLSQHEDFLTRNVTEYAYLEYDNTTDTAWRIWENSKGENAFVTHTPGQAHDGYIGTGDDDKYGVTMQFGIQQHDWDVIIMMAGSAEGIGNSLDLTDIGVIRDYILDNDKVKVTSPKFAWNMTWSYPESTSVNGDARTDAMNTTMESYNNDSDLMFADLADVLENQILTEYDFDYILPNGTAVQNLKAAGYTDEQIYRDRIHASDFTRLMIACNWYCGLTGEAVADITVPDVPAALRYKAADRSKGDYKLQADEKSLIKSCVSNALANPYEITQIQVDDVFKVLVIGHSTGMDPVYFMPAIAKANGQKMLVGDLYHSGCTLRQHDSYIKNDSKEYAYLEYDNSTDTAWRIWETEEGQNKFVTHIPNQAHDSYIGAAATKAGNPNKYGVTMEWAIKQHDWDLIIMLGGRWECADITVPGSELDITDIGAIRSHVLTNDIDKTTIPAFAWNSLWTSPENDEEWKASLTSSAKTSYESRWATIEQYYQGSTQCLYESIVRGLKNIILAEYSFDHLIHNNTLIQNAKNNGLTNYDIYRDYGHCTDYVRAMSAANWYCSITGADVSEITIPDFQAELRFKTADRNTGNPFILTADQKALIVKLVSDTIANPYEVTK